jgi:hypothetical protein
MGRKECHAILRREYEDLILIFSDYSDAAPGNTYDFGAL